jgi:beta-lactamase regulating signal transducer with metallopeptidase domain/protocatechuate 3,4-dioxygenase beta subunit
MNTLFDSAETWLSSVAGLSWKGALFALAVALVVVLLRRQFSPGWRHALWLLVLLRFALPDMGESRWSMMGWFESEKVEARAVVEATQVAASDSGVLQAMEPQEDEAALTAISVVPEPAHSSTSLNPLTLEQRLTLGWLVGVVVMLGAMQALHLRLLRRLRADGTPPSSRVAGILNEAGTLAGLTRAPQVCVTGAVRAPALFGVLRPVILLPRDVAESYDAAALKLIFLHEIAHLQRRDLWTQVLASLILAVHWFNPLAWWAGRRLRVEAEMAADAQALKYTDAGEAHRFGTVLLDFANRAVAGWLLWCASATLLGISENKHDLKRRIEALKDVASRRRTRWGIGLLAFALLSVTGLTKTPAETKPAVAAAPPAGTAAAEPGLVTGVVVDDHGKPVAGASCSLRIGDDSDPEVRKAVSDAQGRFRFESVPESAVLQLRALHSDYVSPREPQPKFSSQDQKEHRLVLARATSWLTGTVTQKSDGQPVPNAAVYTSVAYDNFLAFPLQGRAKARTDAAGRFRVVKTTFDKEKGFLLVDAPGMALQPVAITWKEGGQTVDQTLELEKLLTGRVVDAEGKPVQGASASVCGRFYSDFINPIKSPETGYYSMGSGYWMGEPATDAQGAFSSRVLVLGEEYGQWLVVQHPVEGIQYARLRDWKPGDTLKLERWASAQGTLVDSEGKPVPDTEIRFNASRRETDANGNTLFSLDIRATAKTDAQGRYQVDRITPQASSEYVTVNGKIVSLRRGTFAPGEKKTVDIRIPAPRAAVPPVPAEKMRQIKGRLILPGDRSAMSEAYRVYVSFTPLGKDGLNDQPEVDDGGRFETKDLPADDYLCTVWVSPKDSKLMSARNGGLSLAFKLEPDTARKPLDLGEFKLEESDFAFRPTGPSGPAPWQTMKLNAEVEEAAAYATWVASNGRGPGPEQKFTDGHAAGEGSLDSNHRFLVRATKADGSKYFSAAQVAAEDEKAVFEKKVRLMPSVAVKGRVRPLPEGYDGRGWIIASVSVRAEMKLGVIKKGTVPLAYWYAWAPVARDGKFEFPALPRGSLTLDGFGNGWSTAMPGLASSAGSVSVKMAGQSSPIEVTLDTLPCIERRVRLLRPDGSPAAGAALSLLTRGNTASLALTTRGHAVESGDADAYASYKKRPIPGHSVPADAEGNATLRNQPDQSYGSTLCEVKWTDPQTKKAHVERVKIDHQARSPQEIRLTGKSQ